MTQRTPTSSHRTISSASSSSASMFTGSVPRRRAHLIHIPARTDAERAPRLAEAAPRPIDSLVWGVLSIALAVVWFVLTPPALAGPPEADAACVNSGAP